MSTKCTSHYEIFYRSLQLIDAISDGLILKVPPSKFI